MNSPMIASFMSEMLLGKFEPYAGLSYNSGATDLVVLMNGCLRQAKGPPSIQDSDELFQGDQAERAKDTQEIAQDPGNLCSSALPPFGKIEHDLPTKYCYSYCWTHHHRYPST